MSKLLIKRTIRVIITVLFIYTCVFFISRVTGDPVEIMTFDLNISQEAREQLIRNLGLDKPLFQQYIDSFIGLFTGNAGKSFYSNRPVIDLFIERLPATITLGVTSFILSSVIGIILGFIAANFHNRFIDKCILFMTVLGHTIPNFVLGIIMILLFSMQLRWLPSGGYGDIKNMIMPVLAMSIGPISKIARLTRGSLLDILSQDFLNTSRSKGMDEFNVRLVHALRNALISVITILGSSLSGIIGGSVVAETVFAWPGIGSLIILSAQKRDFPVVVYGVLIIAISVTVVNFLVDLIYMVVDPRIRISD